MKVDVSAMRAALRDWDAKLPRCRKPIQYVLSAGEEFSNEEDVDGPRFSFVQSAPCMRAREHEGACSASRPLLGWPGRRVLMSMLSEIEQLREACEQSERQGTRPD